MIAEWRQVSPGNGELPLLEKRHGQTILRFDPSGLGSQVHVSIDGGRSWRFSHAAARSMRHAELIAAVTIDAWRAENAARRDRRSMPLRARLDAERATAWKGSRRAPRGREETRKREQRGETDPRRCIRWDDPAAADLARDYIRTQLDPSVAGRSGDDALFGVAVAIVRGFCLLPDALGGIVLAEWNRTEADPPWPPAKLRRALERAEKRGSLPLAVLLSTTAEGRALFGSWSRAMGGGAGEGSAP